MKIVAVINQKGGVGKTTTTVNLGAGLARMGRRVLLLDLDPQANLTLHVDRQPADEAGTITDLLVHDRPIGELIQPTNLPRLAVVPADTSLGGVEQALANRIGRETILRDALEPVAAEAVFDYVLVDCPPSLGVLSANALVAAGQVLIPMQTEFFSLQGMAKLTEVIHLVQRRLNPDLSVLCVLPCMVDLRTNLTSEVLSEIAGHFGNLLAETKIRSNVKLAEAPSFGLTIFEHAPESNGAQDYWDFAAEVLRRNGERVPSEDELPNDELDALQELEDWDESVYGPAPATRPSTVAARQAASSAALALRPRRPGLDEDGDGDAEQSADAPVPLPPAVPLPRAPVIERGAAADA